jgi:hypothetical protein
MSARSAAIAGALLVSLLPATAYAQHVPLPPVNLGGSSFVDGAGGPGVMAEVITTAKRAERFTDANGRSLPGEHSLTAFVVAPHLVVALPGSVLGFHYAADVVLPIVHVAVQSPAGGGRGGGIGDVVVNPIVLQGKPLFLSGRPVFSHRLSLGAILPTGAYDPAAPVNAGNNVVSFNPYYAFTIFLTDALETSFRFHYLTSSTNERPPSGFVGADRIRPGDAVHANGAASYALTPDLRVGVTGYWLSQISDAHIDGRSSAGSRERVFGLGPGVRVALGGLIVRANANYELGVEARPAGFTTTLSLAYVWPLGQRAEGGEPAHERRQ